MKTRGWASAAALAAVALALALAVSACGGERAADANERVASVDDGSGSDDNSTDAKTSGDRRDGALKFARCMREHGIDHPDPDENGMFRIEPDQGYDPQSAEFREAAQACERYLAELGPPPELSEQDRKKLEEQMLAFARCMREHGVDMPDPKFSGEGGRFAFELGSDVDPSDPDFRAAEEACREYSPERNPPGA